MHLSRLSEDVPALLSVISDYGIHCILVNNETNSAFSNKVIAQHLKQSATALNLQIPPTSNTSKTPKQTKGCRELGFLMQPVWLSSTFPALIWMYWSPDQRRTAVQLGHDTILACCKVQKETCQMSYSRPVLGCVRSTSGAGFLHSCVMGVYIGCPTYFLSPVDFAANPLLLLHALSRFKIKDTYATPQMMDHLLSAAQTKGMSLHELKNLMISFDGRPGVEYCTSSQSEIVAHRLRSENAQPFHSVWTGSERAEYHLQSRTESCRSYSLVHVHRAYRAVSRYTGTA